MEYSTIVCANCDHEVAVIAVEEWPPKGFICPECGQIYSFLFETEDSITWQPEN